MRDRRPTPAGRAGAVAAVVLALGGVGCGGDDGGGSDDDARSTATSAAVTTTAAEEDGLAGEGTGVLEELAQTLLIQPSELGDASFADAGYTPGAAPAPCGGLGDDPAPDVLAGTELVSESTGTTVVEELRVYASAEDATAAYDEATSASRTGSACPAGVDVAAQVGADRALVFTGDTTYVVALVADTVLTFDVAGTAVDPLEVAAFGAGKVLAALEN